MKKIIIAVVLASVALTGCQAPATPAKTAVQQSEQARQQSVKNVMTATKAPVLNVSLDRENIAKRLERSNDANHIQWMYLLSQTGSVIQRFAVIGKATSGGKRLNSPVQIKKLRVDRGANYGDEVVVVPSPDEMGTYGSSNPYIFWFDLDDSMVQTTLDYIVLDKPVNIKGGTLNISMVDEKELREKRQLEAHLKQGMSLKDAKSKAGVTSSF